MCKGDVTDVQSVLFGVQIIAHKKMFHKSVSALSGAPGLAERKWWNMKIYKVNIWDPRSDEENDIMVHFDYVDFFLWLSKSHCTVEDSLKYLLQKYGVITPEMFDCVMDSRVLRMGD